MNIEIQVTDYVVTGKFTFSRDKAEEVDNLISILDTYRDEYCCETKELDEITDIPDYIPGTDKEDCSVYTLWGDKIRLAIMLEETIVIEYKDVNGDITLRKIFPLTLSTVDEDTQILAFCYLRGSHRAFKLNRVLAVYTTSSNYEL